MKLDDVSAGRRVAVGQDVPDVDLRFGARLRARVRVLRLLQCKVALLACDARCEMEREELEILSLEMRARAMKLSRLRPASLEVLGRS